MKAMKEKMDSLEDKMISTQTEMRDSFSTVINRLDRIELLIHGTGFQFESVASDRIEDFGFLMEKVNKLERDLYKMKKQ